MKRLTIQLLGAPEDSEHIRLFDFVQELEAIREALEEIDSQFFGDGHPTTDYRVVDLRHASPSAVILEPFAIERNHDHAAAVVDRLLETINNINEGVSPAEIDSATLEKIGKIARPYRRRVNDILLLTDGQKIRVSKTFEANITRIIGEDQVFDGSLDGTLEMINFHGGANRFKIYPTIGPSYISCRFSSEILAKAIEAVGQYIRVSGKVKQKKRDRFPYGIDVEGIDILPAEEELPTLHSLRGIAPELAGGLSSVEFVRKLRDAE